MSTCYRTGTRRREDDLTRILLGNRQRGGRRSLEFEYEYEGEFEGEAFLNPAQLTAAVQANRRLARQLGWGCVVGGSVVPITQLQARLGIAAGVSEENLAQAIETWQVANMGGRGDGQLGQRTWERIRPGLGLPAARFLQQRWPVFFGGRQLGVIEKTLPYRETRTATNFGVEIEMGFRVTNMDAVRRAGFVDGTGEDQFRWIQALELRRIGVPAIEPQIQTFRRRAGGRIIDPTSALESLDPHPYYWDEVPAVSPDVDIRRFLNRQAANGLCYDLIFFDGPSIPTAAALPGRRAYFNFETALVGVRPGPRNVILNTFLWGFDIVLRSGVPTLSLNSIRPGPFGGSPSFRRVMSVETTMGSFPGHCFVGPGYARAATCA